MQWPPEFLFGSEEETDLVVFVALDKDPLSPSLIKTKTFTSCSIDC